MAYIHQYNVAHAPNHEERAKSQFQSDHSSSHGQDLWNPKKLAGYDVVKADSVDYAKPTGSVDYPKPTGVDALRMDLERQIASLLQARQPPAPAPAHAAGDFDALFATSTMGWLKAQQAFENNGGGAQSLLPTPPPGLPQMIHMKSDKHQADSDEIDDEPELVAPTQFAGDGEGAASGDVNKEELQAMREIASNGGGLSGCTTAMIKDLPLTCSQRRLMRELDVNGFSELYDFFYIPIDPRARANRGFAFVNFVSPLVAERFYRQYHAQEVANLGCAKQVISVLPADIQGFEANATHYCSSSKKSKRAHHSKPIFLRPLPANLAHANIPSVRMPGTSTARGAANSAHASPAAATGKGKGGAKESTKQAQKEEAKKQALAPKATEQTHCLNEEEWLISLSSIATSLHDVRGGLMNNRGDATKPPPRTVPKFAPTESPSPAYIPTQLSQAAAPAMAPTTAPGLGEPAETATMVARRRAAGAAVAAAAAAAAASGSQAALAAAAGAAAVAAAGGSDTNNNNTSTSCRFCAFCGAGRGSGHVFCAHCGERFMVKD